VNAAPEAPGVAPTSDGDCPFERRPAVVDQVVSDVRAGAERQGLAVPRWSTVERDIHLFGPAQRRQRFDRPAPRPRLKSIRV
jgi:hypothetical protein